ncbi:PIR protein [Plasmodium vivax]|uniref:VIR protein n=2 Tax=Plasmodium vivax TaxID=5855 RepID=A0A565A6S1_PLAVI|nr:PIR protein [Plasmodium vivax]
MSSKEIEKPIPTNTALDDCDKYSKIHHYGNVEKAKRLCNNFARLNKFLVTNNKSDVNHCNFLNYWFNSEFSQTCYSENNCIRDVYNGMDTYLQDNDEYTTLNCELCKINNDKLNKMNKLFNLHKNYSKLNTIISSKSEQDKKEILTLSTQCCAHYSDVSYLCNGDNENKNPEFCKKLNDFKSKYDELNKKVDKPGPDFYDYFIKLSECPNNKIITTAVTGSIIGLIPLFGVLYKFTPMGQVFRSKIGIMNNDINNTDEDMTNISLMGQDSDNISSRQGTYNIKYQSL